MTRQSLRRAEAIPRGSLPLDRSGGTGRLLCRRSPNRAPRRSLPNDQLRRAIGSSASVGGTSLSALRGIACAGGFVVSCPPPNPSSPVRYPPASARVLERSQGSSSTPREPCETRYQVRHGVLQSRRQLRMRNRKPKIVADNRYSRLEPAQERTCCCVQTAAEGHHRPVRLGEGFRTNQQEPPLSIEDPKRLSKLGIQGSRGLGEADRKSTRLN